MRYKKEKIEGNFSHYYTKNCKTLVNKIDLIPDEEMILKSHKPDFIAIKQNIKHYENINDFKLVIEYQCVSEALMFTYMDIVIKVAKYDKEIENKLVCVSFTKEKDKKKVFTSKGLYELI
jgi:hypothetical protein